MVKGHIELFGRTWVSQEFGDQGREERRPSQHSIVMPRWDSSGPADTDGQRRQALILAFASVYIVTLVPGW
jgi:hypothetical protein